ncbi:prepilin-type N-terminal cleavage/methylation domain-containing protein [Thiotrichales bacterium HSG1]|nr:prepilin-type N-terminal cleavage/methylation domain-containing protein [Thiotrichales bacterium HSG1]
MKTNDGFTLVEIAIVFIIIGLVMGTVLKGSELITNAKVKNIQNNFSSISKAITVYREHYHQLPGDDDGASRFKGVGNSDDGGGDGIINGNFASQTVNDESRLLWLHLRSADMVERTSNQQQQPQNAFNGWMGVSSDSSSTSNGNDNGAQGNNMTLFVGFTGVPGNIAVILDAHSDDENPITGRIRSSLSDYDDDNGTTEVEHQLYFSL